MQYDKKNMDSIVKKSIIELSHTHQASTWDPHLTIFWVGGGGVRILAPSESVHGIRQNIKSFLIVTFHYKKIKGLPKILCKLQ